MIRVITGFCVDNCLDGKRRTADAVPAVWRRDGDAGSGTWRAVEAGSVLGLSALRASFLDDLPGAPTRAVRGKAAETA